MKNLRLGVWAFLICTAAGCGGRSVTDAGSVGAGGDGSSSGSAALGGSGGGAGSPIGVGGIGFAGSASSSGASGSSALDAGSSCQSYGEGCVLNPADTACTSDTDCVIAQVPACGNIPLIGINRLGHFVCPAPPCVPPGPNFIVYMTQDCGTLTTPDLAHVRCVDNQCSTYHNGCSACPK